MSPSRVLEALAASELFASLARETIEELGAAVERVSVPGGAVLFHQGEVADCMYVVVSGRLRVSRDREDGGTQPLGEVGRGESVGEMALLTGEPRLATVRAVRDTVLLRLDKGAFERCVERQPATMLQLTRRLVARYQATLRSSSGTPRGRVTTIAIVPTSRDVPLSEFTRRLAEAFAAQGSVLRLNSDRVDAALGARVAQTPRDHAGSSELAEWLAAQEARYDAVLYEADLVRTSWTSRCLRQADQVLLVGSDELSPDLGPIERAMERDGSDSAAVGRSLVILHREWRALYAGTSAWLAPRRVDRHFHVVRDGAGDHARLVRTITGRATAVVLGGGGARSFAQIGVLRAMREAGIEVDMIGGTSMGAYMAAQFALGWDAERMRRFNTRLWAELKPLREYTIPFVGLTAPTRFIRETRATYGEANVEDLGIPFFCCSSNLTRARLMVHDRGPIWRWLGASLAVPGIGPPLFERGDLLVDGAILDNLPIDVMRRRCEGTVIAVDVSPVEDLRADPLFTLSPSSAQILLNRLNPFAPRLQVPSLFEILSRCTSLASVQQIRSMKALADLYLHPPTEAFGMFDWHRLDQLVQVGYEFASHAIGQWHAERSEPRPSASLLRVTAELQPA